jgi:hypothetical protein
MSDFGENLNEMDVEAFFNMREWLSEALKAKGAKVTGGGIGFGAADLDIELDGAPFFVTIKPIKMSSSKAKS